MPITLGYGQRHKAFQDVLLVARERKYLLSTKARYAGELLTGHNNIINVLVYTVIGMHFRWPVNCNPTSKEDNIVYQHPKACYLTVQWNAAR